MDERTGERASEIFRHASSRVRAKRITERYSRIRFLETLRYNLIVNNSRGTGRVTVLNNDVIDSQYETTMEM